MLTIIIFLMAGDGRRRMRAYRRGSGQLELPGKFWSLRQELPVSCAYDLVTLAGVFVIR